MYLLLLILPWEKTGEKPIDPLFFPGIKNNAFGKKIVKKLLNLSHELGIKAKV